MGQDSCRRRSGFPSLRTYQLVCLSSLYSRLRHVVFRVPTTFDVLTSLFHLDHAKSTFDLVNLSLLAFQIILFFSLARSNARIFFLFYFAFWRCAYDAGLGWVLTKQSKKRWIVREVQRRGWLDEAKRPLVYKWIREQLQGKMGKDYSFDVSSCTHPHFLRCTTESA